MEVVYLKDTKYSGVSASILSLAISIAGFSNLELTTWWHFALAGLIILVLYFILFFIIDRSIYLYDRYYKRANIKTDEEDELQQLNNYIIKICHRDNLFEQTKIESCKPIVYNDISTLCDKAIKKIEYIEQFRNSPVLKNNFKISKAKIEEYRNFCTEIQKKYNF